MFGKNPHGAVAAKLSAIDVAETRRLLAEVQVERERVTSAQERAEDQLRETGAKLTAARERGQLDGAGAADALMAGGDVIEAAEPIEGLRTRTEALRAGIGDLAKRRRLLDQRRDEIREDLRKKLADAADGMVEQLQDRARVAIRELLAIAADAQAIRAATGSGRASNLAFLLGEPAQRMAAQLEMRDRRDLIPSRELVALFAPAADAIALTKGQLPG